MSHLPLDARAILSYLNELGYRNITAEQLKEFMKGMQPQSKINNSKQKATTGNSNNQQTVPTTPQQQQQQHPSNHKLRSPKIIKGASSTNNDDGGDGNAPHDGRRAFSLYNSVALQNYYKKKKSLKANRTGWPKKKTLKKKTSARQQQKLHEQFCFMQAVGAGEALPTKAAVAVIEELAKEAEDEKKLARRQSGGVITPPESDAEDDEEELAEAEDDDDDEEEDDDDGDEEDDEEEEEEEEKTADETELEAAESIAEDDDADTMANFALYERKIEDKAVLVKADEEVEEDEDDERNVEGDDEAAATAEEEDENEEEVKKPTPQRVDKTSHFLEENFAPRAKRMRRATIHSPAINYNASNAVATSTPSTQLQRTLRRTPLLNGSLIGSCISPSEKAGDNSDIFTVSSDGLDTDLDLSNSHSRRFETTASGANDNAQPDATHGMTPKRKFDLAKYATNNNAAVTAAKALDISQFLKKEVKVQCRRLRAPFRRFRYRR